MHSGRMAHLHKKMKKGRPYYYVREMARVGGKLKVVEQIYLGNPERIKELATTAKGTCTKISVQEFGALWLANLLAGQIDLVGIVDSVVPRMRKGKGAFGRRVLPLCGAQQDGGASIKKSLLPQWYKGSAIQHIRPVDVDGSTRNDTGRNGKGSHPHKSSRYRFSFSPKSGKCREPARICFLFDTTNYYSYMASQTESERPRRAKNKDGQDWLRQVGVALFVSREGRLPLFYREYEGNRHDSKVFWRIMDELFSAMRGFANPEAELTIVFDKGMNAPENIKRIDAREGFHFITTYSTYFAEEFLRTKLSAFKPIDFGQESRTRKAWKRRRPDRCLERCRGVLGRGEDGCRYL